MKFAKDRSGYRQRLRAAVVELGVSLLTYSIASKWASRVTVGSQELVEEIKQRIRGQEQMDVQHESGTLVLQDEYGKLLERQNASIAQIRP